MKKISEIFGKDHKNKNQDERKAEDVKSKDQDNEETKAEGKKKKKPKFTAFSKLKKQIDTKISELSNQEKKILLMFLGIFFLAVSYLFVFRPQMEEANLLSAQNMELDTKLNHLLSLSAKKATYQSKTVKMQGEIQEYCEMFPADIKEEDGIVLAKEIESASGITIQNVGTGVRQMVSSDGTIKEEESSGNDQTLSQQDNASTQEQVDKIEGKETTETTEEVEQTPDALIEDTQTLYRTQDTLEFKGTYDQLMKAVDYINSQTGRMTVDSITQAFDSSSGGLNGTIVVNLYSMSGTGTTYKEPDAGATQYGNKNLFGSLKGSKKTKKNR